MEVWKDIKGYEGLYQISNLGRIKGVDHWRKNGTNGYIHKGKVMSLDYNKKGYFYVNLCKDGKHKLYRVHRLVYETFVGPIPENMQVNHINEVKTDNRLENLNLMTSKENANWGTRNRRISETHYLNNTLKLNKYGVDL